jgi:tetratricopeptide (TPR) repeat protein
MIHDPKASSDAQMSPEISCRARCSLTMIVRDEERNLPACLDSIAGLFDEIVIVDTGSLDATKEIAQSFGARVFDFPWVDSFSIARNFALSKATGDYCFWLDADDYLEPTERLKLERLISTLGSSSSAYVMHCACTFNGGQDIGIVNHVRLFPKLPTVCWEYRVHELLWPSLEQTGVPVRWSDITITHCGYVDATEWQHKIDRDIRLLRADLAEHPGDTYVLSNLAWDALRRKDYDMVLCYIDEAIEKSRPEAMNLSLLHTTKAQAHLGKSDQGAALKACVIGRSLEPDDAVLLDIEATIRYSIGDLEMAESCWRRLLELEPPNRFVSVPLGLYGHMTRRNLAALEEAKGNLVGAFKEWNSVLTQRPRDLVAVSNRARLARRIVGGMLYRVWPLALSTLVVSAILLISAASTLNLRYGCFSSPRNVLVFAGFNPKIWCRRGTRLPINREVAEVGTKPSSAIVARPVDLGVLAPGLSGRANFLILNPLRKAVVIDRVTTSCPCVRIMGLPVQIQPSDSAEVTVLFDPTEDRNFRGSLSVHVIGEDQGGTPLFETLVNVTVSDDSSP